MEAIRLPAPPSSPGLHAAAGFLPALTVPSGHQCVRIVRKADAA